jgi:hypothetical protein
MKKIFLSLIGLCLFNVLSAYELNQLVDCPTAGILQRGETEIFTKLYKDNGLLIGAKVGLFPRFFFGVSYGAEQVVGNQSPVWHERVEFSAKFRLFDETPKYPAFAIGFDSQGHGKFYSDTKRYDIKSKGFFGVASKNYLFLGNLGFHLGMNYSLETKDKDDNLNFFAGMDKSLGQVINLTAEYDLALNNNENYSNNSVEQNTEVLKKGFFNASLDIKFTDNLILRCTFYDLFQNRSDTKGGDRALRLIYNMTFNS